MIRKHQLQIIFLLTLFFPPGESNLEKNTKQQQTKSKKRKENKRRKMKEEEKRTKRKKEGNNVRQADKTYKNKQFTSITCTYINDDDDSGNSRNGFQKTDKFQKT